MTPELLLNGCVKLYVGDCRKVLPMLPDNSVVSVVDDPPYHFASIVRRFGKGEKDLNGNGSYQRLSKGFMGKQWDGGQIAHEPETWAEVLRVLKPGGHLVAFHSPKNWHRLACAIEDAGFEIRDNILDVYSSSELAQRFFKSLDADQRNIIGRLIESNDPLGDIFWMFGSGFPKSHNLKGDYEGFGTALKPAYEPIVLARKPLAGTVADCVSKYGTGAINISATRIGSELRKAAFTSFAPCSGNGLGKAGTAVLRRGIQGDEKEYNGRWPANVVHDGSDEVISSFPDGIVSRSGTRKPNSSNGYCGGLGPQPDKVAGFDDTGSAARFFYSAKADATDRAGSKHPTVKPISLMRWLVRLITPPGGVVLDPFAGTGTTAEAAYLEGCSTILIEREEEYCQDIRRRMELILSGKVERMNRLANPDNDLGPLFGGAVS